jgi:hypothetical protein
MARKGWIREEFHRVAPVEAVVGDESNDVISVGIAKVDQSGDIIRSRARYKAEILDANAELAAVSAYKITVAVGSAVSADDRPSVIFDLTTRGIAELDVTDVVGGSDTSVFLVITPLNERGAVVTKVLTFDDVVFSS